LEWKPEETTMGSLEEVVRCSGKRSERPRSAQLEKYSARPRTIERFSDGGKNSCFV